MRLQQPPYELRTSYVKFDLNFISLQALCGTRIEVPMLLSHERIPLNLSEEMVRPTTTKRIQGKGLPSPKDPSRRGDLVVHFDIAFTESR